ncbi:PAS domain-containing sensor histidine kinase [Limnoglobus roseus]|uniref:histidine kinase n=1 Tax=Limnoglobus roseus TaxID=2598579 RepID=A0A5C1AL46_9BACT|nr:PAS domain-containing protein [Limnoglobus roseus]QEL18907.1 PAS domain S-box protein [Limnoglobus roseus]
MRHSEQESPTASQAEALRISEDRYRALVLASSQIVWSYAAEGGMGSFKQVEQWWENLTGQAAEGAGASPTRWLEMVHADDRDATAAAWGSAIAAGDAYDIEYRVRGRDGGWHFVHARGVPIPRADGVIREWVGTLTDITAQRRAEADRERLLREVEAERRHLAEVFQHAPSFVCVLRGPDHVFERVNDRYAELLGGRPLVGRAVREAVPEVEGQGFFEILDRVYRTAAPFVASAARVRLARGGRLEERVLDFVYQPLRDADGRVSGILVQGVDLTAHHQAEERLRQAAKMEAVGHLAGGIAHDFNNLLTVINGYSAMMVEDEGSDGRAGEILAAGRRAAELTQQLLAFSRRQVLKPTPFDLNDLVVNLSKMLGRLIGEDIRVTTTLRPAVGRVTADPGQVEQVLVNLCVNARDAMPRGG